MGSQNEDDINNKVLTKREAAELLGVNKRTIFRYVNQGFLRTVKKGNHVCVYERDVLALKASWNPSEKQVPVNAQTFELLHAEIRTLRREMDQVLRILNVRRSPLDLTSQEMKALYQTASQFSMEGWPPQVEELWADYFLRLRADNFRQIEKLTNDKHPWRPFLRLVSSMVLCPWNTELSLQLSSGRDHVLETVQHWFELKKISLKAFHRLINEDARPSKTLLNRLNKIQKSAKQ